MTAIQSIDKHSPAQRAGLRVGETLVEVNGHPIVDVLDYKFYTYDTQLTLKLKDEAGEREVSLTKPEGLDLGLNFETYLMDRARHCANNCIFCFVDQLPQGMRETLYFKDDDARLSFLMGNYITLTNLSDREVQRIMDLHISPINISVHATEPELRAFLLGNTKQGGRCLELMERFASAHITMNCQIVSCPDVNDGVHLQRSMEDLAVLYPYVNSVSIVPVGVTKHRAGLHPLAPYTVPQAVAVVDMVEEFAQQCLEKYGTKIFWCSDEFYLRAHRPIPEDEYFEDYTQLENGVGMLRLLMVEYKSALSMMDKVAPVSPFSIACGVDAAPWMSTIVEMAAEKCGTLGTVYPIVNHFFGETITVSGLVTGGDLIAQLQGKDLGERLLIPVNMLRHGEDVFLDDITRKQVEEALHIKVTPVNQDGFDLCDAIFEETKGGA